ncbi:MAG: signal peptidase I [Candidatus Woesearchaeota archaeon]
MKSLWGKIWYFIWEDDSLLSWTVDLLISFVIIKFLVYPGLGLALGTTHPIVAVVSGSMEHDGTFDSWWESQKGLYDQYNITREEFSEYPFANGFNTGDIMVLKGKPTDEIERGDVIVFWGNRRDPIIHRVVDSNGGFTTKGDHNLGSDTYEYDIPPERLVGYGEHEKGSVAIARVPYLGYIKIGAVWLLTQVM